jgi:hypothetical protein
MTASPDDVIGIPYWGSADQNGAVAIGNLDWSFPVNVKITHVVIENDARSDSEKSTIWIELNRVKTEPERFPGSIDIDLRRANISGESFTLAIAMTHFPPNKPVSGTASVFFAATVSRTAPTELREPMVIAVPYDWTADSKGVFRLVGREFAVPVEVAIAEVSIQNQAPLRKDRHGIVVKLSRTAGARTGPKNRVSRPEVFSKKSAFSGCDVAAIPIPVKRLVGTKFSLDLEITGFRPNERVTGSAAVYLRQPGDERPKRPKRPKSGSKTRVRR